MLRGTVSGTPLSASLVITTMRPTDADPLATFALAAVLRIAARIGALDER